MLLLYYVPKPPCSAFAQPLLNVTNHPSPVNVSPQGANLGQPMVTRPAMMLILKPNHHRRFVSELVIVWVTPCSALWQNYFNSMIFCAVKPKRTTLAPLQQPKKYFSLSFKFGHDEIRDMTQFPRWSKRVKFKFATKILWIIVRAGPKFQESMIPHFHKCGGQWSPRSWVWVFLERIFVMKCPCTVM